MAGRIKEDLTGKKINHWTIIEELGGGKVKVQCDCPAGTVAIRYKKAIKSGQSKSCGCAITEYTNDLVGKEFGSWKVLKAAGNGYETCKCLNCGTIRDIPRSRLLNGISRSCGCLQPKHLEETMRGTYGEIASQRINSPRETWQIEAAHNRDKFIEFVSGLGYKPTSIDISKLLNVNKGSALKIVHDLCVEDYVIINPSRSQYEDEIVQFIKEISPSSNIVLNSKSIIDGYEIDIYLPDKKLAIEFNGTYWHSTIFKESTYHKEKSMACMSVDIHLIHIYEYEWKNDKKKEKIKMYIKSLLTGHTIKGYARECELRVVDKVLERNFLDNYHLQGYTASDIAYGLYYNNNLLSIMTFGKCRFEKNTDDTVFELIRYCTHPDVTVVGGAERLLHNFLAEHRVSKVMTYCSLDKFNGSVYKRLKFMPDNPSSTKPGYVWVEADSNTVLSRYKTQKKDLIRKGLGNESQTEDEIMTGLGYLKVFDAGNLRFKLDIQ